MNNVPLKLYVFFFLSCLLSATTYAQSFHYIYIQTENKEPFYVKMDKNTLNSSESGYILIPKLIEGTYQCSIGFLKKGLPELNITINVKNINEGFLLKNTEEKGWMMVNLQSADKVPLPVLLIPNNEVETKLVGDEFARVLAQVLQDTSIFEAVAVKKYEDSSAIVGNKQIDIPATKGIEIPILLVPQLVVDKITKLQYDSTFENLVIIYQDLVNSIPDTIKLIIPLERSILTPASEKEMEVPYIVTSKVDTVKNDSRFIDMELQNPNQKIDLSTKINDDFVITEKKRTLQIIPDSIASNKLARVDTIKIMANSDCKKLATQNDFMYLRKKMTAENTETDMLKVAKKQFAKNCFTTEHIKNLGVLFISEEEKYNFFIAAFAFVSDIHNFSSLEGQFTDIYYKTKFKSTLSH